jgi:ribosomal protein L16/L10AE
MTKKRRLVLAGAALAICVAVVAGTIMMLPTRPGLSKANFDRVQMGKPRDEIERILGQPLGQVARIDEGMIDVVWKLATHTRACRIHEWPRRAHELS